MLLRKLMVNRITIWCGCFCFSAVGSVFWPILPPMSLQFIFALVGLIAFYFVISKQCAQTLNETRENSVIIYTCIALSGSLIGALWVASVGYRYHSWQLPDEKIQQDVTIKATVMQDGCIGHQSIDKTNGPMFTSYTVLVAQIDDVVLTPPQNFRLSERATRSCLHTGDVFTAVVKVKPAYGTLNPVGYNRQQYLASRRIVATGYIKRIVPTDVIHQHSIRYSISSYLAELPLVHMQWFQALLLGERGLFTSDDWLLIQRTGTAHIFSISGMHLGIIALAAFYLCGAVLLIYRCLMAERARVINYRIIILLSVLMCALAYTALSGMALPVIRAFVLLTIATVFAITKRALRPTNIAVIMLFICITLFPLSLLQASFYLSIGAVMCIWFMNWRFHLHRMPWYKAALAIQLGVSMVMAPVTLLWFGSASVVGVLANVVVLPVITLLLPVALLMLFIAYLSALVMSNGWAEAAAIHGLHLIDVTLGWLISFLQTLSIQPMSAVSFYPKTSTVLCLFAAMFLLVLPRWRYRRRSVLILLAPLSLSFLPYSTHSWYVHVFDAGQGSAIAVTRGSNALIIDSGPAFDGHAHVAQNIIPQFLAQNNSLVVDWVIHSHSDLDHSGGKVALAQWLNTRAVQPQWISPTDGCVQGRVVQWQELTLTFLWPKQGNEQDNNAMSCVVKISDGVRSILLPGDIERTSEYALLNGMADVSSDVLVAPHHGSKTSSTDIWIRRVDPDVVIFTQGYENRWKFPNQSVYERYQKQGILPFTTSEHGYIRVEFSRTDYIVTSQRGHSNQRWYLPRFAPRHINIP